MRNETITCDFCGKDIQPDSEWNLMGPLNMREPFAPSGAGHFQACIDCMGELEAKRKARATEAA